MGSNQTQDQNPLPKLQREKETTVGCSARPPADAQLKLMGCDAPSPRGCFPPRRRCTAGGVTVGLGLSPSRRVAGARGAQAPDFGSPCTGKCPRLGAWVMQREPAAVGTGRALDSSCAQRLGALLRRYSQSRGISKSRAPMRPAAGVGNGPPLPAAGAHRSPWPQWDPGLSLGTARAARAPMHPGGWMLQPVWPHVHVSALQA